MLDLALLYPRLNRKSGQKERAKRFALHGPRATQGELVKLCMSQADYSSAVASERIL